MSATRALCVVMGVTSRDTKINLSKAKPNSKRTPSELVSANITFRTIVSHTNEHETLCGFILIAIPKLPYEYRGKSQLEINI